MQTLLRRIFRETTVKQLLCIWPCIKMFDTKIIQTVIYWEKVKWIKAYFQIHVCSITNTSHNSPNIYTYTYTNTHTFTVGGCSPSGARIGCGRVAGMLSPNRMRMSEIPHMANIINAKCQSFNFYIWNCQRIRSSWRILPNTKQMNFF